MSSLPRLCLQDEYSIFPQTYSIDINGYILVYSVTSNKRSAFKKQIKFCFIFRAIAQVLTAKKKNELCPRFFPALKSYKLSMKNCWTWWEKSSKYLFSCPGKNVGNISYMNDKVLSPLWCRVPIMLVGNKNDLHMERYVLPRDQIVQQEFSKYSPCNSSHLTSVLCLIVFQQQS